MGNQGKKRVVPVIVLLCAMLCLCVGFWVRDRLVVKVQGAVVAHALTASTPVGVDAARSYPAETVGVDDAGTHVHRFLQKADYTYAAFDGELLGADRGEWGGELVFRDASGAVQTLLRQNVRGILGMPFGVVVFTGLSHMGHSTGAIFRVEQRNDGAVVATPLHVLRGAPGDVRWTTRGDLVFTVDYVSRGRLFGGMHTQCFLLKRSGDLRRQPCLAIAGG